MGLRSRTRSWSKSSTASARRCRASASDLGGDLRAGPSMLQLPRDILLQLDRIGVEQADAFGGFFRGHRVLIEEPAEVLFVQLNPLELRRGGGLWAQLPFDRRHALL